MEKYNKLPKCPSRLIRLALKDLRKAEASGVRVNMGNWMSSTSDGCTVCLAGSVMMSQMGAYSENIHNMNDLREWSRENTTESDFNRLMALDAFRKGLVAQGLWMLDIKREKHPAEDIINISPYFNGRSELFYKDMNYLADYLQENGL